MTSETDDGQRSTVNQLADVAQKVPAESAWLGLARRAGMDRAVGFAVLMRFWQLFTGPITQLFIVFFFSEVQQGYYYAFMNLLAMHIFVELGLHVVIINVASHEWSGLQLTADGITGDLDRVSRLRSLAATSIRWYAVAAALFVVLVSVLGTRFFLNVEGGSGAKNAIGWFAPWIVLVILTGLQLAVLPLTAILEGCGQLPVINRLRFLQGVVGSLVVWSCMFGGLGLWALCGSAAVRLGGELYLVAVRYQMFFSSLRQGPRGKVLNWRHEILPLQWRMAIQGALLWLSTHLAGLVVLKYHGAAVSGRFGMMWTILAALQAASLSWVETRRPLFGRLIAERDYQQLDSLFFRLSRISMTLMLVGGTLFTLGIWLVNVLPWNIFQKIAERLPSAGTTSVFAVALVILHLAQCTNIYVRAHKRDPYLLPALIANPVIAILVFRLGQQHGIVGVGWGYLAGVALLQTPLWMFVWARTRRIWHADGDLKR